MDDETVAYLFTLAAVIAVIWGIVAGLVWLVGCLVWLIAFVISTIVSHWLAIVIWLAIAASPPGWSGS